MMSAEHFKHTAGGVIHDLNVYDGGRSVQYLVYADGAEHGNRREWNAGLDAAGYSGRDQEFICWPWHTLASHIASARQKALARYIARINTPKVELALPRSWWADAPAAESPTGGSDPTPI